MPTIEERIKPILAAQFCKEIDEIDLSANIAEKYESDSLDLVEVTMTVEDEFGIEIDDEKMDAVETGQHFVDIVRAKVPA